VSLLDTEPTCPARGPHKGSLAEENLQDKSILIAGFLLYVSQLKMRRRHPEENVLILISN